MKKYLMPEQEKQALERLKQPFAVYQFVDKRVVTLALSDGFCELFGYEDRKQAYHDMDNDLFVTFVLESFIFLPSWSNISLQFLFAKQLSCYIVKDKFRII